MPAKHIKISYPVPSNKNGHPFTSAEQLLSVLNGESSGLFLVGSEGMWHGGIHITDATVPWCALSSGTAAEQKYLAHRAPYPGEQPIRCMAEGKIVAWRVCKDYDGAAIPWRNGKLFISTSFVLVEHCVQPGEKAGSGLTFHTLYMNMAPYEAYVSEQGAKERKLAGSWRYYASAEEVLASPARPAGSLVKGTAVTLSDAIISRAGDHRQFTQVTLSAETKNAKGEVLAAGTRLWTVSDRGALKAAAPSVPLPSWWEKCAPAYGLRVATGVACTAHSILKYYLSSADVAEGKNAGTLATGFPMIYEPDNAAQQYARPVKKQGDEQRTFSLVTLGRDIDSMKKGDRVWVVSDKDNLTVGATAASGGKPAFGKVVIPPEPVAINAGDSIGHMGFYQLPTERESESRYQVHIECISTGDGLPAFLTNPEKAGEDAPAFLKYPEGAKLYAKDGEEKLVDAKRLTRAPGILTLSGVPVIKEGDKTTHYRIRPEGGWLAAANVKLLSQWALGELGFTTLDRKPQSFDLLDGVNPPKNVVQGILQELYKVAQAEPRTSAALYKYNYKYLLDEIDQNKDGYYSEREYLQAVHLPSYRDHLYRLIAKHPSEWYYGKADELWTRYLDQLKKDVPEWKTYLETFIDRLAWMKQVPGIGPEPWHMHPVVFLEALRVKEKCRELFSTICKVILQHEGGYVNDPDDRGGETNMGITIATWRKYAYSDIGIEGTSDSLKKITSNQAEVIYYNHYWEPRGFCKLESAAIALMIYDWTITSGRAITQIRKMLHDECNLKLMINNAMDDDMIHCINAVEDQGLLLQRIAEIRRAYYRSLTYTNGEVNSQVKFLSGWLNRVDDCLRVKL